MKINILLLLFGIVYTHNVCAQSSGFEINPDGVVFPRKSNTEMNAIQGVQGQCIYNTTMNSIFCYNGIKWRSVLFDPRDNAMTIDTSYEYDEEAMVIDTIISYGDGSIPIDAIVGSLIIDEDRDTKVDVEQDVDEDMIRFVVKDTEVMRHNGQSLEMFNNGQSVFIGEEAGDNDDLSNNKNTYIGYRAGRLNRTGVHNVAIGNQPLNSNVGGSNNVAIGQQALFKSIESNNIAIGLNAAKEGTTAKKNVSIGGYAGFANQTGTKNTLLGYEAGRGVVGNSVNGSVMIGHQAGYGETEDNRLYIANDDTVAPLIYGEFDSGQLGFNARLAVGHQYPAANHTLDVFGHSIFRGRGYFQRNGNENERTITNILESSISKRPVLLFSEGGTDITNGMSIEYDGRGQGINNKLYINQSGGTPKFTFSNNGRLGIGTVYPFSPLDVTTVDSDTNEEELRIANYGDGDASIKFVTGNVLARPQQYIMGIDQSDSEKFKLVSTQAAITGLQSEDVLLSASRTSRGVSIGTSENSPERGLRVSGDIQTDALAGSAMRPAFVDESGKLSVGPLLESIIFAPADLQHTSAEHHHPQLRVQRHFISNRGDNNEILFARVDLPEGALISGYTVHFSHFGDSNANESMRFWLERVPYRFDFEAVDQTEFFTSSGMPTDVITISGSTNHIVSSDPIAGYTLLSIMLPPESAVYGVELVYSL